VDRAHPGPAGKKGATAPVITVPGVRRALQECEVRNFQ
jgi:hypothetical protein